jgi:glutathione S-transferase
MGTKVIYGADALQAAGIDWKSYIKLIEQRPSAQKVTADRKADQAVSVAARAAAAAN